MQMILDLKLNRSFQTANVIDTGPLYQVREEERIP